MKNQDLESWLIEVGDQVISKKMKDGYKGLEYMERMLYCFWVVDYSIRNSGTLEEVDEIFPQAMEELNSFKKLDEFDEFKELLKYEDKSIDVFEKYEMSFDKIAGMFRELLGDRQF